MKLRPIATNVTELTLDGGTQLLFSYETPVACFIPGDGYYRTGKRWSQTTSRHINKWLDGVSASEKPQAFFDSYL